jgi:ribosomal protein L7/L12
VKTEITKLKDKVGQAGARVARAQLNLELAQRELEVARKCVVDFNNRPARFDVYLRSDGGTNKIQVIKAIRDVTYLGLKEAKDVTDRASIATPQLVKLGIDSATAADIKLVIERAGGTVEIRAVP